MQLNLQQSVILSTIVIAIVDRSAIKNKKTIVPEIAKENMNQFYHNKIIMTTYNAQKYIPAINPTTRVVSLGVIGVLVVEMIDGIVL